MFLIFFGNRYIIFKESTDIYLNRIDNLGKIPPPHAFIAVDYIVGFASIGGGRHWLQPTLAMLITRQAAY